nr:phospholipase A2 inhibitor and Ly6/PLAUR domain-containing protein-like [Pelodiscus sinensis]|eukprot:XP_006120717.1 phospholipase A2 inhibitor and Ly6/PLAUR domain-containing protein-like [Pelodiscus sinensis]
MTNFASSLDGQLTFTAEPGRYVRISTKKCNADQCNKDPLTVPQVKDSPNGLQCPSCQAVGASTCIPVITPCKGEETFCVNLIGTFKKAAASPDTKFAALGCATPSADAITKNLPQQLGMFRGAEWEPLAGGKRGCGGGGSRAARTQ